MTFLIPAHVTYIFRLRRWCWVPPSPYIDEETLPLINNPPDLIYVSLKRSFFDDLKLSAVEQRGRLTGKNTQFFKSRARNGSGTFLCDKIHAFEITRGKHKAIAKCKIASSGPVQFLWTHETTTMSLQFGTSPSLVPWTSICKWGLNCY